MAGNGNRDPVRCAGARDGASCLRGSDCLGDLCVACRRARRDTAQRLPHAMLKGRPADIEREVETKARILDEADYFGRKPFEIAIASVESGARKLFREIALEALRLVAEENGADSPGTRRNQDQAERALTDRISDIGVGPAGTELTWGHAEHLRGGRVEAAVRVEAGAVDRLGHCDAPAELLAKALVALRRGIGLRRHAEPRLEQTMEMIGA